MNSGVYGVKKRRFYFQRHALLRSLDAPFFKAELFSGVLVLIYFCKLPPTEANTNTVHSRNCIIAAESSKMSEAIKQTYLSHAEHTYTTY